MEEKKDDLTLNVNLNLTISIKEFSEILKVISNNKEKILELLNKYIEKN